MNRDICYCANECDNLDCIRNQKHTEVGVYSLSYLKDTECCPTYEDEV